MNILFESEALLVVDKPHGWLTIPAREKSDPRPCLGLELQKQLKQQIFPVHRLDFEVGGLTLWAKNPEAHRKAQSWFEQGKVRRLYEAYSAPGLTPVFDWQEWHSRIVRGKKRSFEAEYGKPSLTQARVVATTDNHWKWELVAMTGRPHQLRFEMMKHGSPILGDHLYGGKLQYENFIALRAIELSFTTQARYGLPEVCRGSSGLSQYLLP